MRQDGRRIVKGESYMNEEERGIKRRLIKWEGKLRQIRETAGRKTGTYCVTVRDEKHGKEDYWRKNKKIPQKKCKGETKKLKHTGREKGQENWSIFQNRKMRNKGRKVIGYRIRKRY